LKHRRPEPHAGQGHGRRGGVARQGGSYLIDSGFARLQQGADILQWLINAQQSRHVHHVVAPQDAAAGTAFGIVSQ